MCLELNASLNLIFHTVLGDVGMVSILTPILQTVKPRCCTFNNERLSWGFMPRFPWFQICSSFSTFPTVFDSALLPVNCFEHLPPISVYFFIHKLFACTTVLLYEHYKTYTGNKNIKMYTYYQNTYSFLSAPNFETANRAMHFSWQVRSTKFNLWLVFLEKSTRQYRDTLGKDFSTIALLAFWTRYFFLVRSCTL